MVMEEYVDQTERHIQGISYIVPAYNEEPMIAPTVSRLESILSAIGYPFEIIVVDDGSRDRTRASALAQNCRVISHPGNMGYGAAIKTGIRAAQYEIIGLVDADGTYEIERLPELTVEIEKGFDMVIAERQNVFKLDKPFKRLVRRILLWFLRIFIAKSIRDPNSGFRLFRRDLALTYFPFLCNTFSFTTSITLFALGDSYFVQYVPSEYSVREGKSKVRHFRDSLRMAQLIIQGVTFANPLKLYLLIIVMHVVLVAIPAAALDIVGLEGTSNIYFWTGSIAVLLGGLGLMSDLIRINTSKHNIGVDTSSKDDPA